MSKTNFSVYSDKLISQKISARTIPIYAPGRTEAREKVRARARATAGRTGNIPRWMIFAGLVLITFAFCVILNVRANAEMLLEQQRGGVLNNEIRQLQKDNASLAEEINSLQTDPATIERAARQRLNMVRANEKILILSN